MENITIQYAGCKVAMRIYEWEREAMQRVAGKFGINIKAA